MPTARAAMLVKSISALLVAASGFFALGCGGDGGRWHHYSSGGSFIGAKPSMSPDGKSIVFASPRSGRGDIFRVSIDGKQTMQLTDHESYEGDPSYTADGKRITFVREHNGIAQIWIMQADGSDQKQLTKGSNYDHGPSVSPDGAKIVFAREQADKQRGRTTHLFVIKADGSEPTQLTSEGRSNWEASFSPTGNHILYSRGSAEIWLMERDGSKPRRINDHGATPSFSPDGKKIVFVSGKYGRELSVMDADGANAKAVYRSEQYMAYPTFCPDGEHILFLQEDAAPRGTGMLTVLKISDGSAKTVARTD